MESRYFVANGQSVRSSFAGSMHFGVELVDLDHSRPISLRSLIESLAALALFIVLSPLYLVCFLAIKLTSDGPAIYSQERVGLAGETFTIYKFRSMIHDAEKRSGAILSSPHDDRITPIGKLLRNTHLDELPQIFNIIRGDMSFVGPRPERTIFVQSFNRDIPQYVYRSAVKPGVTGLAQVCCSYDATPSEKLEFDLLYINHRNSLKINLMILVLTIKKIFHVRYNV